MPYSVGHTTLYYDVLPLDLCLVPLDLGSGAGVFREEALTIAQESPYPSASLDTGMGPILKASLYSPVRAGPISNVVCIRLNLGPM